MRKIGYSQTDNGHGQTRWQVNIPLAIRKNYDGKTKRLFETEKEAKDFAAELNESRGSWTGAVLALAPETHGRLLRCLERMNNDIGLMEQAIEAWVNRKQCASKTLQAVYDEALDAKVKAGFSTSYLRSWKDRVLRFTAGRESKLASEVTVQEVLDFVYDNNFTPQTRKTRRACLKSFFSFAQKRGYVLENPGMAVQAPAQVDAAPCILTVKEVARLLHVCRETDPGMLSYFALCIFAGIRPQEVRRLEAADFQDGLIEIKGRKAKTRARRLVEVHPTLRAWLALSGELSWPNFEKRFRAVRRAAGFETWGHDCMRHTFVSCHFAIHGAAKTAIQAGHSEAVLFQHYRALVRPADAEAFWALTPERVTELMAQTEEPVRAAALAA